MRPKTLGVKHVVTLTPKAPFNFDASLHKPDHFPSGDNAWEPDVRWQTMLWQGKHLGLKFENWREIEYPEVRLSIWSKQELSQDFHRASSPQRSTTATIFVSTWLISIADMEPMRSWVPSSKNGEVCDLSTTVRSTNICWWPWCCKMPLSGVRLICCRPCSKTTGNLSFDGKKLFCFWEPEVMEGVSEAELRDLKVGYRAKSIKRVTEAFVNGKINEFELRKQDEGRTAASLARSLWDWAGFRGLPAVRCFPPHG